MNLDDLISSRRTIRQFQPIPIPIPKRRFEDLIHFNAFKKIPDLANKG